MARVRGAKRAVVVLTFCASVQACGAHPPAYSSDEEDAAVYADVATTARSTFAIEDRMSIHPWLAVATDDAGMPTQDLTTFEYEPSPALAMLANRDSTIVLCQPDEQGICRGPHVVFSQITRLGERDALVIAQSIRGPGSVQRLLVELRYYRNGWGVSGYEVMK